MFKIWKDGRCQDPPEGWACAVAQELEGVPIWRWVAMRPEQMGVSTIDGCAESETKAQEDLEGALRKLGFCKVPKAPPQPCSCTRDSEGLIIRAYKQGGGLNFAGCGFTVTKVYLGIPVDADIDVWFPQAQVESLTHLLVPADKLPNNVTYHLVSPDGLEKTPCKVLWTGQVKAQV